MEEKTNKTNKLEERMSYLDLGKCHRFFIAVVLIM
jgi:hypothetical protein